MKKIVLFISFLIAYNILSAQSKIIIQSSSSALPPAVSNGLSISGSSVQLGGTLNQNTAINPSTFGFSITGQLSLTASTGALQLGGYSSLSTSTDSTTYKPMGMDASGNIIKMTSWIGSGGGTTSYQTQTASGSTAFTFTSVPASFDDYIVFVNGVAIRPTTDYTTSGNIITISSIISGDVVRFQRIK